MFHKHGVPKTRLEFLRSVPLFSDLPDSVLERLDSHLDEIEVPEGRRLTTEGSGSYETFIIAEGTAQVRVDGEVVREASEGELIGEVGVLQHTARTATVSALTPMRLLVVSAREIAWLFEDETLSQRVRQNLEQHLSGPQSTR